MAVYLDASAIIPLFLTDTFSSQVMETLRTLRQPLIISDWAILEVSSVIVRQIRTKQLTQFEADTALTKVDLWFNKLVLTTSTTPADIATANTLVRRRNLVLRGPDAVHIAIAQRVNANLLTFDKGMQTAAREIGLALTLRN